MMFRKPFAVLSCGLVLLSSSCTQSGGADPAKIDSYSVKMPVKPAPGEQLQRLSLPAGALISLERPDLADVRVFDANGKALPMALIASGQLSEAQRTSVELPAYPIVGTAGSLRVTGVSLKIDAANQARIVGIDGTLEPRAPDQTDVVGTLLDTRSIENPAIAIDLATELPAGQPITFVLEKSGDLKNWQPLAEKVMFRPSDSRSALGTQSISLQSANLSNLYVRVTWNGASGSHSKVAIMGASVTTSRTALPERISVPTSTPKLVDPHDVRFAVPFATRISAVRMSVPGESDVTPVTIFGRNGREEPWRELSVGVLRKGGVVLELGSTDLREFWIEADKRTSGFPEAPKLELLFQPVELAVQFDEAPPYLLAAGLANATNSYLTAREIAPGNGQSIASSLPMAKVNPNDFANPTVPLVHEDDSWVSVRQLVLWLALVIGAFVLGFAALRLFRANSTD